MSSNPLVSVIIIFFNGDQKFFEEAIKSVFEQTYGQWELLLVDDGSTNICSEIALWYAERNSSKVRYLEHAGHQNHGMSASRNLGIRNARGVYIGLLDADDIWLPQKLERQVAILETQPEAGIVFGPTEYWYSWSDASIAVKHDRLREIGVQPNKLYQPPSLLPGLLQDNVNAPAICSVLLRREVFEAIGGFEETFRDMFEDRVFFTKVYLKIPAFVDSRYWDRYRQHDNSMCAISERNGIYNPHDTSTSHKRYLKWVAQYFSSQEVMNYELWQALHRSLLKYYPGKLYLDKAKHQALSVMRRLWHSLDNDIRDNILLLYVRKNVKHIHGPISIDYSIDDLIVLCVVRNGELYIKSFIEHYLSLGVKHIIFLDNNSTDTTIDIAKMHKNVTVLWTDCPYQKYETVMKKYLVNRFSKNRWNIFADIDELFDYPLSNTVSLKSLLSYLNKYSYTAVVTQMLDMFSDKPLNEMESHIDDSIKDMYIYYDISEIQQTEYPFGNVPNADIKMHSGGIRKSIFGTDNGLTKVALTFIDKHIKPFAYFHHTKNARIADISCIILHYPFLSSFYDKVMEAVQTDRYRLSASGEYKNYWERLKQEPNLTLRTNTACLFNNTNNLININFLAVSDRYIKWAREYKHCND